jgi:hypothetical protein
MKDKTNIFIATIVMLILVGITSYAQKAGESKSYFFGDHILLQIGKKIRIWVKSLPNAVFKVSFSGLPSFVKTNNQRDWIFAFSAHKARCFNTPQILSDSSFTYHDITIDDVQLFSKQSNIKLPLSLFKANHPSSGISDANLPRTRGLININSFTQNYMLSISLNLQLFDFHVVLFLSNFKKVIKQKVACLDFFSNHNDQLKISMT